MKQHEFIWAARNMQAKETRQDDSGNTFITLRNDIHLVHNYKKKDRMTIEFQDDKSVYIIPTDKELKEIYRLHLENVNLNDILHQYCSMNLTKIEQ